MNLFCRISNVSFESVRETTVAIDFDSVCVSIKKVSWKLGIPVQYMQMSCSLWLWTVFIHYQRTLSHVCELVKFLVIPAIWCFVIRFLYRPLQSLYEWWLMKYFCVSFWAKIHYGWWCCWENCDFGLHRMLLSKKLLVVTLCTCILFCCGTSENMMVICKGVKHGVGHVLVRGGQGINYPPNVLCLW